MTDASAAPPRRAGGVAFALALAYLVVATLYAWQASRRLSPTIFSDEIELTQLSRSIAETGSAARRGESYGIPTLYAYVLAPAWWIDDTTSAWEAVKLIGALVMSATLFPAYALARYVVERPWAVAAAVASVAAPPLAYAPYLMQEPLAYPVSTLGLLLVARYADRPTLPRLAAAAAFAVVAWQVRDQLAVLLAVLAAAAGYHLWRAARFRAWRAGWTSGDWVGFALLLVGAAVVLSAAAGHRSERWYVATGFLKQKLVEHAVWAIGAVGLGLGVLPLVAGLAVLLSPRLHAEPRARAFVVTGCGAIAAFVAYAALKGAFVSTVLGPLVVERNVIYVVPVLTAATAAALAARAYTRTALALAGAATLLLLANLELHLDQYPYFEAPSLAIGQLANRNWAMDDGDVRRAAYLALLVSIGALSARLVLRRPHAVRPLVAAIAIAVSVWSVTAEVYAARGLNRFAERLHDATPKPLDWVDRTTGGEPALYLGQQERDHNAVWLLEFWNRSIERVWSVDGSTPAPTLTPDLSATDGRLSPDPGVRWVVARDGVAIAGDVAAEPRGGMTLYRLDGPLRLRYATTGVEPDGWMGARSSFSLYVPETEERRGFARVVLSRQGACGDAFPTSTAVVRLGPLAVGENRQPALARVDEERRVRLRPCAVETVVLRAAVPFHVEVEVQPTFKPSDVDAGSGDTRDLGAQVGYGFLPLGS